ncbi:DUF1853 family protein [Caballeronia sp. BR00000012568055]|uniref:DUF1853 family protein n=1 Tax=Caballeronia sp. BR00000012568055 TaxID=2918761 RepID=UPI0023F92F53|nr:DUF1853 family protein [Caballeronia sp. BR00000012568055]
MTGLARIVDRFEDVTVRDLAWLLFAPDLLRADRAGMPLAHPFADDTARDAALTWLHALDAMPDALHARVRNPKSTRLGIYAESLLEFFLANGPSLRLLAANVPLRQGKRTIGECDFLLESNDGARLHWELAVKFYLHIGDGVRQAARLSDYVGPNLQDRFDVKHARLLTHQMSMTTRPEFDALDLAGPWRAQLYMKGRLFYHDAHTEPAPELGGDHLRGWWMTASEWRASHDVTTRREQKRAWVVQPRMAWLASRSIDAKDAERLIDDAPLLSARLAESVLPTMVAVYQRDGDENRWSEESRGFIVPDDWPERARAYAAAALTTT